MNGRWESKVDPKFFDTQGSKEKCSPETLPVFANLVSSWCSGLGKFRRQDLVVGY